MRSRRKVHLWSSCRQSPERHANIGYAMIIFNAVVAVKLKQAGTRLVACVQEENVLFFTVIVASILSQS